MIIEGIKRLKESLERETNPDVKKDLKAVACGMSNFYLGLKNSEAIERFENHCKSCEFNIQEPLEEMKVKDSTVPQLSGRQCGLCGCVLSFKIRQSIKKCQYWK